MRNSGPFLVIRLSFTSRTKNSVCLLFDFSKGFLQTRRGLRLLNHRFLTRIRGRLGLFPCFTPSHTPFPRQKVCSTSEKIPLPRAIFARSNYQTKKISKLTFRREKKMQWGPTCCVTHGVYSGKKLNTVSARSAERD